MKTIEAELPPLRMAIDVRLSTHGAGATWTTSDGGSGILTGSPADVAEALAGLVLRLAGVPVVAQDGGETQRVRAQAPPTHC